MHSYIKSSIAKNIASTGLELLLDSITTHETLCTKLVYVLHDSIGIQNLTMASAACLFDTNAGLNFINANLTDPERNSRDEHNNLQKFHNATKDHIQLQGASLLHLQIGGLHTRVGFRLTANFALHILFGHAFFGPIYLRNRPQQTQMCPIAFTAGIRTYHYTKRSNQYRL